MSIPSDNPKIIYASAPNPTAAPGLTLATRTHALGTPTWYVAVTWVTAGGETMVGPEASIVLTANNTPVVTPPEWPANATSCKIYAGTVSGTLYYQGTITDPAGTWQFPASGLLLVTAPPVANTTPTTLWLPRKFVKWDRNKTRQPAIVKGTTYTQVQSYPALYEIKCTTGVFDNTTENWRGSGAEAFKTSWVAFWDAFGGAGRPFEFYRNGSATTEGMDKWTYTVWTLKDDGLTLLIGRERYQLEMELRTEGAAR